MKPNLQGWISSLSLSAVLFAASSCSTLLRGNRMDPTDSPGDSHASAEPAAPKDPKDTRIEALEMALKQAEEKANVLETELRKNELAEKRNAQVGTRVEPSVALSDPERGYVLDSTIQNFRQGKALFDSKRYPEAVLAFSQAIDGSPDHPLAGQIQYYLAESYFRQSDYPVAESEFKKIIQLYPRSAWVGRANLRIKDCAAQNSVAPTATPTTPTAPIHSSQSAPSRSAPIKSVAPPLETAPMDESPAFRAAAPAAPESLSPTAPPLTTVFDSFPASEEMSGE